MPPAAQPPGSRPTPLTSHDPDDRDQPSFLAMVGLVALVVAIVILVFFGIGYLFGRVFL
jgi:hypothetical protein